MDVNQTINDYKHSIILYEQKEMYRIILERIKNKLEKFCYDSHSKGVSPFAIAYSPFEKEKTHDYSDITVQTIDPKSITYLETTEEEFKPKKQNIYFSDIGGFFLLLYHLGIGLGLAIITFITVLIVCWIIGETKVFDSDFMKFFMWFNTGNNDTNEIICLCCLCFSIFIGILSLFLLRVIFYLFSKLINNLIYSKKWLNMLLQKNKE